MFDTCELHILLSALLDMCSRPSLCFAGGFRSAPPCMCFSSEYFRRGADKMQAENRPLMTSFSSPPPLSLFFFFFTPLLLLPLPALIAHSPRLPRYFSHCLHLLRLITLFFSLSSPAVYRSLPSLVPPSLFFLKCAPLLPLSSSPSVSCIFFPPVCPFIPLTLLLCLITRPLPLHFHSLSPLLHAVVLCLPACLPACLSIP